MLISRSWSTFGMAGWTFCQKRIGRGRVQPFSMFCSVSGWFCAATVGRSSLPGDGMLWHRFAAFLPFVSPPLPLPPLTHSHCDEHRSVHLWWKAPQLVHGRSTCAGFRRYLATVHQRRAGEKRTHPAELTGCVLTVRSPCNTIIPWRRIVQRRALLSAFGNPRRSRLHSERQTRPVLKPGLIDSSSRFTGPRVFRLCTRYPPSQHKPLGQKKSSTNNLKDFKSAYSGLQRLCHPAPPVQFLLSCTSDVTGFRVYQNHQSLLFLSGNVVWRAECSDILKKENERPKQGDRGGPSPLSPSSLFCIGAVFLSI